MWNRITLDTVRGGLNKGQIGTVPLALENVESSFPVSFCKKKTPDALSLMWFAYTKLIT